MSESATAAAWSVEQRRLSLWLWGCRRMHGIQSARIQCRGGWPVRLLKCSVAVIAVIAVMAYTPIADIVLMSAWIPSATDESGQLANGTGDISAAWVWQCRSGWECVSPVSRKTGPMTGMENNHQRHYPRQVRKGIISAAPGWRTCLCCLV